MLKDETIHFSLSLLVGIIVGYLFDNYWAIPLALLGGFFIDGDHLIDYFIHKKFRELNTREFFKGEFFDDAGKVYVFLHGFEYVAILVVCGLIWPQIAWVFYSFALANFLHLLYDTLYNGAVWPTYFIVFRMYHNFSHKKFNFPKCQK